MSNLTLAISAGGKSSRMGTDKSFVTIGGQTIVERIIERTQDLGQAETILISNQPEKYQCFGLSIYPDVFPDKGSLGGIYTALYYSSQPYTLVIACDMPFISPALLSYMCNLSQQDQFDIIVPRVDNYPEGLHALYHQNCLEPIKKRLDANQLKVIGFYNDLRVRYLDEPEYKIFDPYGIAFMNVNTPEELKQARQYEES